MDTKNKGTPAQRRSLEVKKCLKARLTSGALGITLPTTFLQDINSSIRL